MVSSIHWRSVSVQRPMIVRVIALLIAPVFVGAAMPSLATPKETAIAPLISFELPAEARAWQTVNDGVMGGRSLGGSAVEEGKLVFTGSINTRGGGFSSVRREMEPGALEGAQAFVLQQRCKFTGSCSSRNDGKCRTKLFALCGEFSHPRMSR